MNLEKLSFEELIDLLAKVSKETRKCHWTLSYLSNNRWSVNLVSRQLQFYHEDKSQVIRDVLNYIYKNRTETRKVIFTL